MLNFFERNNLFASNQFDFRRGLSSAHAVISQVNKIIDSFEAKEIYTALFVDLRKAFDTVSHKILIKKTRALRF